MYDTAKAYLGKHEKKHQDWFDPNDHILLDLMAKRTKPTKECCTSEAPDPRSKLTKMPSEYYRDIHEFESLNGEKLRLMSYRDRLKEVGVSTDETTCTSEII